MSRYSKQVEPRFSSLHKDADLLWVVPFRVRYILGICGYRYVGKSTALSYLVEKRGFRLYSLSTTLRRLAAERGISSADRTALQDFGDEIRRTEGADHLARLTLREIRRHQLSHRSDASIASRIAVGGFKRPEEVAAFRSIEQFKLLALTADDEVRYRRANEVGAPADELGEPEGTWVANDVIRERIDTRDRVGRGDVEQDYGQAVERVVALVDASDRIANTGDLPRLLRDLARRVDGLDTRYRRARG
jgi:cytidylate kinase